MCPAYQGLCVGLAGVRQFLLEGSSIIIRVLDVRYIHVGIIYFSLSWTTSLLDTKGLKGTRHEQY